jgi:hypothetical protein
VSIFSREFNMQALERAVKTAAQAAILAIIGTAAMAEMQSGVNAFAVDWVAVGGFTVGGFVLSYLTSVVSAHIGPTPGPSLVKGAGR